MLYSCNNNGKNYIQIAKNKFVEVEIRQNGHEYNVIPTQNKITDSDIIKNMKAINPESAYKRSKRRNKK